MYGADCSGLGELAAAPFLPVVQQINCCAFDGVEEGLWVGTDGGVIGQLSCPSLDRYSSIAAHAGQVMDLRSVNEGSVSISSSQLCLHGSGGAPRLVVNDEVGDFSCLELDVRVGMRAVVGRDGGDGVSMFDLATGRAVATLPTGDKGVVGMCGPVSRGLMVVATADGCFSLVDLRGGAEAAAAAAPLQAHAAGFAALDARGNFLATAGYASRMGRVVLENHVKVYDVRMTPRMLSSIPFALGPSMVRFHPKFSGTVLVGGAGGVFTLADAQGLSANASIYQVDTEGDALVSCAISPSGECWAFGGSGGYVHLWAATSEPSVCGNGQVLVHPEPPSPLVHLGEEDPPSQAPLFFSMDGSLLSDVSPHETAAVGLPPRLLDPSLLQSMKQSDFVGYIPNPKYEREGAPGAAARAVWPLRNQRIKPRPEELDQQAARAERSRRRAAAGGTMLPGRYRRVSITSQSSLRFEEFDFSYYNRTPFAGLENNLANCYTNALLQVLFFVPPMRDAMLQHAPDLQSEFSLAGELSFLFRMMAAPGTTICQASNLLRALRQSREAAALGLLEGVRGERGSADIEVEAHKERSLASRVQSLARFMLEQLHKEGVGAGEAAAGGKGAAVGGRGRGGRLPASAPASPAVGSGGAARAAGSAPPSPGAPNQRGGLLGGGGATAGVVERVFGMPMAQRMQCLSKKRGDVLKEISTFQVDLRYPALKDWPSAPPLPTPNPPQSSSLAEGGGVSAWEGGDGAGAPQHGAAGTAAHSAARPSFSHVLQSSLVASNEMRAWFDEEVKYQYVRQERVPRQLPQVLVLNCGLKDRSDLRWWQPYRRGSAVHRTAGRPAADPQAVGEGVAEPPPSQLGRPWLPPCLAISANPHTWSVEVEEGEGPGAFLAERAAGQAEGGVGAVQGGGGAGGLRVRDVCGGDGGGTRAVYQLSAAICHICDEDEVEEGEGGGGQGAGGEYEGHLVAHIRIPPAYYPSPSPALQQEDPAEGRPGQAVGDTNGASYPRSNPMKGGSSAPAPCPLLPAISPGDLASLLPPSIGGAAGGRGGGEAGAPQPPPAATLSSSPLVDSASTPPAAGAGDGAAAAAPAPDSELSPQEAQTIRQASETLAARSGGIDPSWVPPRPEWLVFNDFHIGPCPPQEVGELFGGQKAPCLLYYTKVDSWQAYAASAPASPTPVLTSHAFLQLCKTPPLQAPKVRLRPPSFNPLGPHELPHPGMLLALDAEFVAYSPPEKKLRRGVEVEVRPSRLGLARVSVVRGAGPSRGSCCIDDYIRGVEPVYDYLTKYSGLVPGDLDPSLSPHYLTTLRRSYAKLRHLVDSGCVFVGHGLKKDFRMINIVVPTKQMIDTVDLFHAKRSRKLSLRFLASYLLRAHIQTHTHDSIEDACTALRLYEVYQRLMADGTFESKLQEMYDWGKVHGWEPVVWKDGKPHPAPPAAAAPSAPGTMQGAGARGGMLPPPYGLPMGTVGGHGHRGQPQGRPGGAPRK